MEINALSAPLQLKRLHCPRHRQPSWLPQSVGQIHSSDDVMARSFWLRSRCYRRAARGRRGTDRSSARIPGAGAYIFSSPVSGQRRACASWASSLFPVRRQASFQQRQIAPAHGNRRLLCPIPLRHVRGPGHVSALWAGLLRLPVIGGPCLRLAPAPQGQGPLSRLSAAEGRRSTRRRCWLFRRSPRGSRSTRAPLHRAASPTGRWFRDRRGSAPPSREVRRALGPMALAQPAFPMRQAGSGTSGP